VGQSYLVEGLTVKKVFSRNADGPSARVQVNLDIEREIFKEKLEIKVDVPAEVWDCSVPHFGGFNHFTGQIEPGFERNARTFFIRASYLFRKSF
jgi:hypothetical protein